MDCPSHFHPLDGQWNICSGLSCCFMPPEVRHLAGRGRGLFSRVWASGEGAVCLTCLCTDGEDQAHKRENSSFVLDSQFLAHLSITSHCYNWGACRKIPTTVDPAPCRWWQCCCQAHCSYVTVQNEQFVVCCVMVPTKSKQLSLICVLQSHEKWFTLSSFIPSEASLSEEWMKTFVYAWSSAISTATFQSSH